MDPITGITFDALRATAAGAPSRPTAQPAEEFGDLLGQATERLIAAENRANNMIERFAAGEEIDVHQVMLAVQEGETTMMLGLQVRNKLVEAYQEVMRMQV